MTDRLHNVEICGRIHLIHTAVGRLVTAERPGFHSPGRSPFIRQAHKRSGILWVLGRFACWWSVECDGTWQTARHSRTIGG